MVLALIEDVMIRNRVTMLVFIWVVFVSFLLFQRRGKALNAGDHVAGSTIRLYQSQVSTFYCL